jgi:hypothetical protein
MFQTQRKKRTIPTRIVILTLSGLLAPCANAQELSAKQRAQRLPSATPRSGALVGLTSGQTLWIAPVGDKIQVLVAPDYVIPRKDGFWRVRLGFNWNPGKYSTGDPELLKIPEGQIWLWAVPLNKGLDAVAWPSAASAAASGQKEPGPDESTAGDTSCENQEEENREDLTFLSPNYLSYFSYQHEVDCDGRSRNDQTEHIYKIIDAPLSAGRRKEQLFVEEVFNPISDGDREKEFSACLEAQDTDAEAQSLRDSYDAGYSFGIRRINRKWRYDWLFGGADASCTVSVLPLKNLVGDNELFPDWKQIKSTFPAAEDAFSSPPHDLLLVLTGLKLIVAPVHDGKIGKSLGEITLTGKPVMVQWAIGRYVDAWTNELTHYFDLYHM